MTRTKKKQPDEEVAYNYFISELKENPDDYRGMPEDRAFELFSARLVLKPFSPTYSEIENGIVGGPEDGGIDSLYAMINNRVLPNGDLGDTSPKLLPKKTPLDLFFIQSKNSFSWNSNVWTKMDSTLKLLLNGSLADEDVRELQESGLSSNLQRFSLNLRKTREKLSNVMPVLRLHCIYVSFAVKKKISKLIYSHGSQLESTLKRLVPTDSLVSVEYWDCLQIQKAGSQSVSYSKELKIIDQAIIENDYPANKDEAEDKDRNKTKNFVALVTLSDYLDFIRDKTDDTDNPSKTIAADGIKEDMFATNVRDYAGNNKDVNKAIISTLKNDSSTRFWWLNNGITILADEAYDTDRTRWTIENPLIVNGLQTSFALFNAYQKNAVTKRRLQECLLVRVITSKDEKTRQDIITGTNKQTSITKAQLHANDSLQLRIEDYLRGHGWYYERRKFQYRNKAVPFSRIRTTIELSQAVMAYRLLEPDQARARPMTYLNKNDGKGWELVFPTKDEDLTLYLKAIEVQSKVDAFLRKPKAKKISSDSLNARYYLTSCYSLLSSGVKKPDDFKHKTVSELRSNPSDGVLEQLLKKFVQVSTSYDSSMQKNDQLYKSTEFRDNLFAEVLKDEETK